MMYFRNLEEVMVWLQGQAEMAEFFHAIKTAERIAIDEKGQVILYHHRSERTGDDQ